MQAVMRVILHGEAQPTTHDTSSGSRMRRRRQLVVQEEEEVVMSNEEHSMYTDALNTHTAIQSAELSQEIVEYVHNTTATTELRVRRVLQEALSDSHAKLEAAIAASTDQRTIEIEGRLQEMLQVNHAELEAAATAAIDQQTSSIGTQLSASLTHNDTYLRDRLSDLRDECEVYLQATRGQCENIAVTSAKSCVEQEAATIEHRLQMLLSEKHTTIIDSKLEEAVATLRSEAATRASVCAEVQGEAIEERLQQKLDAAISSVNLYCHNYVDHCVKDVSASLGQAIRTAREDAESKYEARSSAIESRMQQMLWDAEATRTKVVAIEEKAQNLCRRHHEQFVGDFPARAAVSCWQLDTVIRVGRSPRARWKGFRPIDTQNPNL